MAYFLYGANTQSAAGCGAPCLVHTLLVRYRFLGADSEPSSNVPRGGSPPRTLICDDCSTCALGSVRVSTPWS
jgi:hypothetical protein